MVTDDISKSVRRVDAVEKCNGTAKYIADYAFEDCNWAKMVRSSVPRGKILKINLPELPEGYFFVSYKDIPKVGKNSIHIIADDWKCFADDYVQFVGETIGLIVGPDKTTVQDLFEKTTVDYQEETPAITIDDAINLVGGAQINDDNVQCRINLEVGENFDEAMKGCAKIVEETIETGFQEHIYLETNGACCIPEGDKYIIYASAQCPFYIRNSVAGILNLDPEKIVVRQTTTGGGFGGKENFPDILCGPLLVAAYKTKKGVKMFFDREEDIEFSVKRHPSKVVIKTGLDKDGNIQALDTKVYYNVGVYLSSSFVVLQRGCMHMSGCYSFPHFRTVGLGMYTNTFPSCAFRGFGAPQTLFAIETHLCHLAEMLGVDPVEYKSRYFIKQGDLTSTNGKIVEKVVIPEMLDQVMKASDYKRKAAEYKPGSGKGIGIAFYNHGGAFTGNGEQAIIKGKAKLKKYADGTVEIFCAQTEMGQGFTTILRKIAAKVLDLPYDSIKYHSPDTAEVPNSGPTVASRSTMVVGRLIEKAALKMKERFDKEEEFEIEEEYKHPDGYPWDQSTFQGYAYLGYGWGVCAVEVEVDPCTSEVSIKGVWSSHDAGHVIDELVCHGQVNGGVLQGIGWASTEVLDNVKGHFKQTSMSDYIIPSSMDCPTQSVNFVDNPYQWGPFGAKGMGELVFNGSGAAYIDAVSRAIGKRISSIPCPTEKVMEYVLHGTDIKEEL